MLGFMKCVVEAVAADGIRGLLELVPGGSYLHKVGADAIKRYRDKNAQKKLEDEVKEMIAAKADAVLAAAKQAIEEAAPELPPREKELVLQFVTAMPEAARQSLKRKDDPTGASLPFGFTIHEADDVAKILPQHAPRFVPGDWVPGREDNWRLERRLGGGGFGEVWLARHHFKKSERPRAVKFCTDPGARTRLVTHEKRLIVQVMEHAGDHPNIVPLLECHLTGETPWLMYEFVDGGTLADAILDWQRLVPAERLNRVVAVLHTIAGAVGHCHAMTPAIIHRDLKPANILMAGGVPRVTDFGIGGTAADRLLAEERAHSYASVVGRLPSLLSGSYSLMYSSPQQRDRERPDPRDDVHALGVIAYQMFVGRLDAEVKGNWQKRLRTDGVPDALIDLIGNSTSDDAADRPMDAREWEKALAGLLTGAARPAPVAPKPKDAPPPANPVRAPSPPAATSQKWHIAVPGLWYARAAGSADAQWWEVAKTPEVVTTRPDEVYMLSVSARASDSDLAGLSKLTGMPALQSIELLYCTKVTDAGLEYVRGLTSLRALKLAGCDRITDAGVSHLKGLSALQWLDLSHCKRVTAAAVAAFQNALPNCRINR